MKKYVFLRDSEELVSEICSRFVQNGAVRTSNMSNHFKKIKKAYQMYYGKQFNNSEAERGVGEAGEQGEFAVYSVNHLRSLIKTQYSMITQNKIVFDAQAENTDTKSRNATIVANLVLDQYFDEKNIESKVNSALELGLVTGTSYIYTYWDTDEGKPVGVDGETGQLIKAGEVKVELKSVYDVFVEPWQDSWEKQQWCIVREIVNRFDLVDIFPELEDEILQAPQIKDLQSFEPYFDAKNEDYIFLYKMYHKHTHALPEGRQTWFLDDETVLYDELESPYKELPVEKFCPEITYGSNFGHCPTFDLLPIQEAFNIRKSSILTNQKNFAVQNIIAPRTSEISATQVAGGMNYIEYSADPDMNGKDKPEVLQLLATPAEVFNESDRDIQDMEQISGINEVVRGKAGSNVTSGTMAAVLASASQNYLNATELAYQRMVEKVATKIIRLLAKFMTEEDILTYTGKSQKTAVVSFKGDNLEGVKHVKIQTGNPLGKSLAGRLEAATQMLNQGLLASPQQFLEIIQTGSLQNTVEEGTAEMNLIQRENEQMSDGVVPVVSGYDNHSNHLKSHKQLLMRPEVRENPKLLQAVLQHMEEHMNLLDDLAAGNPVALAIAMDMQIPIPTPNPETGVGEAAVPADLNIGGAEEGEAPQDTAMMEGEEQGLAEQAQSQAEGKMDEAQALFQQ